MHEIQSAFSIKEKLFSSALGLKEENISCRSTSSIILILMTGKCERPRQKKDWG
jgi:hypothetical protein